MPWLKKQGDRKRDPTYPPHKVHTLRRYSELKVGKTSGILGATKPEAQHGKEVTDQKLSHY